MESIIITIIVAILTTLGTYYITKGSDEGKNRKEEIEKAVALAQYYEKELLTPISVLLAASNDNNKDLRDILRSVPFSKGMELSFTYKEAEKYIGGKNIVDYVKKRNNRNAEKSNDVQNDCEKKNNKVKQRITVDVSEILNKLEFWCMYFNKEIANENIVYSCLHQTFLSVIQALYIDICMINKGNLKDKYYCNIIEMFNRWNKIDVNKAREIEEINNMSQKAAEEMVYEKHSYKSMKSKKR